MGSTQLRQQPSPGAGNKGYTVQLRQGAVSSRSTTGCWSKNVRFRGREELSNRQ